MKSLGLDEKSEASSNHSTRSVATRIVFVVLVGLINFLIPIVWIAVEPPTMQFRECIGTQFFSFSFLFFQVELLLIIMPVFAGTQARKHKHFARL